LLLRAWKCLLRLLLFLLLLLLLRKRLPDGEAQLLPAPGLHGTLVDEGRAAVHSGGHTCLIHCCCLLLRPLVCRHLIRLRHQPLGAACRIHQPLL
jgi:hypothetical protein